VGDVVVCPAVATANAPSHAGSTDDEIALLLVHGTLHLLGYDHMEDGDRARMWARERELLDQLWGPLGSDPWATT
jgi:probable rRNA maturation factor